MREIVHLQAGQCGNQIGAKVCIWLFYSFLLFCYFLCFCSGFQISTTLRLKRKNQPKIIWPHPSDDDWSDHEKEYIKKYICFRLRLGDIIGQNVCKRDWCTDAKWLPCYKWLLAYEAHKSEILRWKCSSFFHYFSSHLPFLRYAKRWGGWPIGGERAPPSVIDFYFENKKNPIIN